MKLAGGTRRRLLVGKLLRTLQAADEGNKAAFDLKIELQPEADAGVDPEEEGAMMMSSAKYAASEAVAVAVFGMILASAYALW